MGLDNIYTNSGLWRGREVLGVSARLIKNVKYIVISLFIRNLNFTNDAIIGEIDHLIFLISRTNAVYYC